MFVQLFLLFTIVTMTELALLIQLGQIIGPLGTVAMVLITGALGASLARWQGMQTLWKLQNGLGRGEAPTDTLIDGAMILFAGAVLLTPGVLTDLLGFTLLIPQLRDLIKPGLKRWFSRRMKMEAKRGFTGFQSQGFSFSHSSSYEDEKVVEGEIVDSEPPQGEVVEIHQQPNKSEDSQHP